MSSKVFSRNILQSFTTLCTRPRDLQRNITTSVPYFSEKIVIPKRIPRSPTDILQALASTVGRDTSGPHYKYHDDPYLTPASNMDKRMYSLSKESGRKAAKWILNNHGDLFQHQPEDPVIEAFYPKITYSLENDVSEATLDELIRKFFVSDAIQVYQACNSKGIELSEKICQDLLELLCYYNCNDTLDEDWIEERWYSQVGRSAIKKTWKGKGIAEEVFSSLETKDSKAYCALIRGMSKYFEVDNAWALYEEAQAEGIPLDTETYNSAIRMAPFLRENSALRWELMKDIMQTMAEKGITPNLATLNTILEALVPNAGWRPARDISLQVFSEFSSLGIKPSLATYYSLLRIHCRERGPISNMLVSILDQIEGKTFEVRDMKDIFFFTTAMDISCHHLKNFTVAQRVNDLLLTGNNYCLVGDAFKESIYHRHYFTLACQSLAADDFMDIYHDMVPHVYTPEPSVMKEIITSMQTHEGYNYLPQLWSDIIIFSQDSQEKLVTEVLACISCYQPSDEDTNITELTQQISGIAWDIWTRVQSQKPEKHNKISWSGTTISDVLITLVQCKDYEKAVEIFIKTAEDEISVLGFASAHALNVLSREASERNDSEIAVKIVLYAVDAGLQEAAELANKISSKLDLSQKQKAKITAALGIDIIDVGESH